MLKRQQVVLMHCVGYSLLTRLYSDDQLVSLDLIRTEDVARNILELDSHFSLSFVEGCNKYRSKIYFAVQGLVAQWITRLPTEQEIPGSNPGKLAILLQILRTFSTTHDEGNALPTFVVDVHHSKCVCRSH